MKTNTRYLVLAGAATLMMVGAWHCTRPGNGASHTDPKPEPTTGLARPSGSPLASGTSPSPQAERADDASDLHRFTSAAFPPQLCRTRWVATTQPDGSEQHLAVCERVEYEEPNEYAQRSSQDLEAEAQLDPRAAQMLAIRSRDANPTRALNYAVRATALGGGDALPLIWYMREVRPRPGLHQSYDHERFKMNYVLSGVAEALDSHTVSARHAHWRRQLDRMTDDPELMATLNRHIDAMLEQINRIQQDVGIAPTSAD